MVLVGFEPDLWRPTGFLQCFDTVGLVFGHLACKTLPEMTYYMWDVKPYTVTHSRCQHLIVICLASWQIWHWEVEKTRKIRVQQTISKASSYHWVVWQWQVSWWLIVQMLLNLTTVQRSCIVRQARLCVAINYTAWCQRHSSLHKANMQWCPPTSITNAKNVYSHCSRVQSKMCFLFEGINAPLT